MLFIIFKKIIRLTDTFTQGIWVVHALIKLESKQSRFGVWFFFHFLLVPPEDGN